MVLLGSLLPSVDVPLIQANLRQRITVFVCRMDISQTSASTTLPKTPSEPSVAPKYEPDQLNTTRAVFASLRQIVTIERIAVIHRRAGFSFLGFLWGCAKGLCNKLHPL